MDTVKLVHLIETTITRRGKGISADPIRVITQYWTLDGKLVAEMDPLPYADSAKPFSLPLRETVESQQP